MVAGLVVSGCSGGKQPTPSAGGNAEVGTTSDINPQDPATLRNGGNLRLALTSFPSNFNTLNVDGNDGDTGAVLRPTMPRAFVIAPDGSMKVNTDYFTSVELTSTSPQVVTYTINPKAVWSDGNPITWEDIAAQINARSGKNKAFVVASPDGAIEWPPSPAAWTTGRPSSPSPSPIPTGAACSPATHVVSAAVTATPEAFNKGQLNGPGPSAGPFLMSGIDRTAQRIT